MLTLAGRNLLLGGVHDHWSRADFENPAVLLAALNYYHYDFVTLMCGPQYDTRLQEIAAAFTDRPRLYLGREEGFGWAHIVTVNPRRDRLPAADTDIHGVLRQLKETSNLVILAHPNYIAYEPLFETGVLDELLDEGLLDGIQFTADSIDQPQSRECRILEWYQQRESRGRRTPVVSGWDLHLMKEVRGIPPVLYGQDFIPDGHFEAPCSSRTILFCEENTLSAICAAIKAGQTVVERLPDRRLYGPSDLVHFLEANGYRETITEMDRRRDSVSLRVSGPLQAGRPAVLSVSHNGHLRLPISLQQATTLPVKANEPLEWPQVPVLLERDLFYQPLVWHGEDGQQRIWAVESQHPIQLDILPLLGQGAPGLEVLPLRPFSGEITVEAQGLPQAVTRSVQGRTRLDLSIPLDQEISEYTLSAKSRDGFQREFKGNVTFFGARRFRGDWTTIPTFGVNRPCFVPKSAYGKGRPWPGPQVYSATLQFAWTDDHLFLRAVVTDSVHYQPFRGHYMYNADCLQLAIDPMLRRRQTLGNVYAFNLALTNAGPELYRTWSPDHEATDKFAPPPPDVSLGDQYLNVTPWAQGVEYELKLPWSELAPVEPTAGHRMGVYFIMFNNDGSGHLDTLHWPVPIPGMWTKPARWGVLTLLN